MLSAVAGLAFAVGPAQAALPSLNDCRGMADWERGKEFMYVANFFTMPMLQLTVIFLLLFLLFLLRLLSSVQPQHTANWIADTGAINSLIHVHLCASCMFLRRRWECNAKNWTEVRKREKRDVDKWCIFIMLKVVSIVCCLVLPHQYTTPALAVAS